MIATYSNDRPAQTNPLQLDPQRKRRKGLLAAFELGYAPASAIAKQAGLNRITAYEALKRLVKRVWSNLG